MELSASQIKYLLAAYTLHRNGAVRSADIAGSLGVTRPSVHRMITQLSGMRLLKKEKYSSVSFTELGATLAERYHACFSGICTLLCENLNLPRACAEDGAFAILSGLETEMLEFAYAQTAPEACGPCARRHAE